MKWSKEEIDYLVNNFGKVNARDIAKHLNRGYDGVHKKAQSLNLIGDKGINRKFTLNHDFFSVSDVITNYWAGFIAADGCITSGYLKIMLNIKDLKILESFKKDLQYTGNIYINKKRQRCSLEIRSAKIINDLKSIWNITERKSLSLEPPNITSDIEIFSYIRGYIDGDGSVYTEKSGYLRISIIGTYNLLKWMKEKLNINSSNVSKIGNIYKFRYSGKNAMVLFDILKNLKTFHLSRKWDLTGYNPYDKLEIGAVTV